MKRPFSPLVPSMPVTKTGTGINWRDGDDVTVSRA
jgi:hypothetical protein